MPKEGRAAPKRFYEVLLKWAMSLQQHEYFIYHYTFFFYLLLWNICGYFKLKTEANRAAIYSVFYPCFSDVFLVIMLTFLCVVNKKLIN